MSELTTNEITCARCGVPVVAERGLWVSTPSRSFFCVGSSRMHQPANAVELSMKSVAALCADALSSTPGRTWHAGCLAAAILIRLKLPVRRHDDRGRVIAPCPDCLAFPEPKPEATAPQISQAG